MNMNGFIERPHRKMVQNKGQTFDSNDRLVIPPQHRSLKVERDKWSESEDRYLSLVAFTSRRWKSNFLIVAPPVILF